MRAFAAISSALLVLSYMQPFFAAESCICDDSGNSVTGVCEDAGPGSVSSDCELGRDCTDCGPSDRFELQAGTGCQGTMSWLTASSCENGLVDPITDICYCNSPAASSADNCTAVDSSCDDPCITGTESCCDVNSVLVRVLGYNRQQIAANDPVHNTYIPFTEESDVLSMIGTDYAQIEALEDGSTVYAHGDALEVFSPEGKHMGTTPVGVTGLVASCLRRLSSDLLLVCDTSNSSVLLTKLTMTAESLEINVFHQITMKNDNIDMDVNLLDLAFSHDAENQTYTVFLLALDAVEGNRSIFSTTFLDNNISSWIDVPSNESTAFEKLFDVDWTSESYGLETAPDGSLLIASRETQYSVMRYTPAGTRLGEFFTGEATSSEIHHIRRSSRGLYYLTDRQSKSQVLVLGGDGQFQGYVAANTGYLAEAAYLALPNGPYSDYCTVSGIEPLTVAGSDMNITITIRDQDQNLWDNDVTIGVVLAGAAIHNHQMYTLGQDLSEEVVDAGYGMYSLPLKPTVASLMYPNETGSYLYDPQLVAYMEANGLTEVDPHDFMYHLTITMTSFGFLLRTQSYAVSAANTSALGTAIEDSHAMGIAGKQGELEITARDIFGNRKLEGGESSLFTTLVIDGREGTEFSSSIVDKDDGTYGLRFIAFVMGTQLLEVRFDDQQIVHSPVAMAIASGEINITTSFLYAQGVHYFDIDEPNLVFFQPRDSYGNYILFRKSISTSNFTIEIDVPHSKFEAQVGNVSYRLDGTFRTGYRIYMSPSKSDVSTHKQDEMLEQITLSATYNGEYVSTAQTATPMIVLNHRQYEDNDVDRALQLVGVGIAAVGILIGIVYSVCILVFQSHQLFKFGNRGLMWVMCLATAIACAAPVAYGGKEQATDSGCIAAFWLFHIGTALMLSALLAKTSRLVSLMQGSRVTKSTSIAERPRAVIAASLIATLVYLMLWTVTIPPKVRTFVTKEQTAVSGVVTKYEQEMCSAGSLGWNYPILAIELAILGYTMLLAHETRKLNRALLDGKQMSYVLYNFLFWGAAAFIVFLAVDLQAADPAIAFFVVCLMCFLCYALSLSILMVPKFWKAATFRERKMRLSDYLKPKQQLNPDDHPRNSTVELPPTSEAPEPEEAAAREGGTPVQEQYFL